MSITCEVCNSILDGPRINFGEHPLCDDLVAIGTQVSLPRFTQEIQLCKVCLTAHQIHPVEKTYLFKSSYHYRSALTKDVLVGMSDLVNEVLNYKNLDESSVILDIGCNDGSLLRIFKEVTGCITIGVDPTDAINENRVGVDFAFQNYFDEETANRILSESGKPDVITFTNVFAHIEDLPKLLLSLKMLLKKDTLIVVENHYLGSILERNQFDTFYHEHPRTYSAKSFSYISANLGMSVTSLAFPKRYGGNIRVFMQAVEDKVVELPDESNFIVKFQDLKEIYRDWIVEAKQSFKQLVSSGPVFGKSLPGRAVMLLSSLGITSDEMPILFEQPNSPKVGYCVPGTNIEIHSDNEIAAHAPDLLVVWSWHIADEICEYLQQIGFKGDVWVPLPKFHLFKTL